MFYWLLLILVSFFLLGVFLLVLFVLWNLSTDFHKIDHKLGEAAPGILWLVFRVVWQALFKSQGRVSEKWDKVLSSKNNRKSAGNFELLQASLQVFWTSLSVSLESLTDYNSLCCRTTKDPFRTTSHVPPCYLETLFMKPLILVASSSNFPVSPFGLIHVRQRIKVHEPLDVILKEKIDLQATVSRVERVEKGIEVDVTCRVFLNRTDVCIWEGITTVLSRSRETLSRAQGKGAVRDIIRPDNGCLPRGYQVFSVAESTGLKYAVITGDYNPHHLYPWTAKWLGYKKPIAHGMWTLQRALQSVKGMCPREIGSGPMIIDCSFKRPLFMPSRIKVNFWRTLQENCLRLVVTNAELETDLHLDVHVRTL